MRCLLIHKDLTAETTIEIKLKQFNLIKNNIQKYIQFIDKR